jgi:hypothetical protein
VEEITTNKNKTTNTKKRKKTEKNGKKRNKKYHDSRAHAADHQAHPLTDGAFWR